MRVLLRLLEPSTPFNSTAQVYMIRPIMPVSNLVSVIPKVDQAFHQQTENSCCDFDVEGEEQGLPGFTLVDKKAKDKLFFNIISVNPMGQSTVCDAEAVGDNRAIAICVQPLTEYNLQTRDTTKRLDSMFVGLACCHCCCRVRRLWIGLGSAQKSDRLEPTSD